MRATQLAGSLPRGGPVVSGLLHAAAAALLFTLSTGPRAPVEAVRRIFTEPLMAPPPPLASREPGGGGGAGADTPASLGVLPRAALRQFTPPAPEILNPNPVLPMEPTLVAPVEGVLPRFDLPRWGLPAGAPGPPSAGTGKGSGIGDGDGTGVGSGRGPRFGSGDGPGAGGRALSGAVTPPALLWKVEPEYSEDARKAKVQGTVLLSIEIDERGAVRKIAVRQGLGLGLDERAIETVRRWKFRPGTRDGRPVPSTAVVEVNFRLL